MKPTLASPAPIICSVTLCARRSARRRDAPHPLNALKFRACEGFYSKNARACTWPCSITQIDASDEMDQVYEALVHWADAIIVASPIRWGAASSLYFKMAERLNCVQNAITIRNQVLIRNKVAGFIIVGGQDNIQAVAGQMLGFFAELGFSFPAIPLCRAFARLVARRYGAQRRNRARIRRNWRKARGCWPSAASTRPATCSRMSRRAPRSSAAAGKRMRWRRLARIRAATLDAVLEA